MNRRTFAQWLALGAGAAGLNAPANAQAAQAAGDAPPSTAATVSSIASASEFETLARAKLPESTFDYISSGSTDQITLRENVAAFGRIKLLPPLLTGVATVDTSTTVLGTRIALPVMLAPVAALRLYHPEGAAAAARAATAFDTLQGVSSSVCNSVEEVAAASVGPKWFQLYMPKDRDVAKRLVQRAEHAGYKALVLTVDLGERKDPDLRHGFALPRDMLLKQLTDQGFTQFDRNASHAELLRWNREAWDQGMTWEVFEWLRSVTKLPLLIKGVLRADDARRAVALGLDGIVVSNHGGRRLDGMPATIDMLGGVVEAVGGKCEVFLDSGVRRGTDVFKALALGARGVLVGRPYAWALAAEGEAGVRRVLELLGDELRSAMQACGCATLRDINRSLLA